MDFRRFDQTYYIRMDKGDEIIGTLLEICRKEKIASAVFSGIGGCSEAEIQTFIPEYVRDPEAVGDARACLAEREHLQR